MLFAELLQIAPEFTRFTDSISKELDGHFSLRSFAPHELIHQKDSHLDKIGILLKGSFRVVNEFENGNVFMIEINQAISFTGEVTLLAGANTTSVTIETITECLMAFVPVKIFDSWLREDMKLLRAITEHIAIKLYRSSYVRGERLFYSAKYVLLKYITQQAEKLRIRQKGKILVQKTRQEISEEVGMTVKTINRILTRFCEDDLISTHKGKITLDSRQYHQAQQKLKVYMSENRNGAKQIL